MRGFLRRLCRDASLADDLAQDSFLRAWRKLSTYRARGSLGAWFMQIAYREFLQAKRRGVRYGQVLDEYARTAPTQENHGASGDVQADLETLLAVLSEDERVVMILAYSYGMSHAEISTCTAMPVGTVKSHVRRARHRIRKAFDLGEEDGHVSTG